jgi:excisionase family DNA binding protein
MTYAPASGAESLLALPIAQALINAMAEEIAARVLTQLAAELDRGSPWLDFEGAMAYTGFSRDKLYKLTAAKAIPFRKKEGGQGLLFHKDELDAWFEMHYPRQDRLA